MTLRDLPCLLLLLGLVPLVGRAGAPPGPPAGTLVTQGFVIVDGDE